MSAGLVLAIAVPVLLVLAAAALLTTVRRRDRDVVGDLTREATAADKSAIVSAEAPAGDAAEARERSDATRAAIAKATPAASPATRSRAVAVRDAEEIGVTRRQFFNRGILGATIMSISGFGAASVAFLWPGEGGGFGGIIAAPAKLEDLKATFEADRAPVYVPEAKSYLQPYPTDASVLAAAEKVYEGDVLAGMQQGIVALWQTCPHLGCRVPWCQTSQWFECPCHGSKYNRVGEKTGGPAPRGMDRFGVLIGGDGSVSIDTGTTVEGPAIGTNTTGQNAEGPFCV
jgi:cytochrome b6-f complex iron-sulfur subunit